jgi:peptidoglycan hydrolase CwlO-like protein
MKMQEDNEDLSDKWKSQVQSKDAQIAIMNDQVGSLQSENEKQRNKMKELANEVASLES